VYNHISNFCISHVHVAEAVVDRLRLETLFLNTDGEKRKMCKQKGKIELRTCENKSKFQILKHRYLASDLYIVK